MNFLQKFRDFISRPSHSRTMGIVIMLVLVSAVSLTVIAAQQQQTIRQQASGQENWHCFLKTYGDKAHCSHEIKEEDLGCKDNDISSNINDENYCVDGTGTTIACVQDGTCLAPTPAPTLKLSIKPSECSTPTSYISFTWNTISGASKYTLYRQSTPAEPPICHTSKNHCEDTQVVRNGNGYVYKLFAEIFADTQNPNPSFAEQNPYYVKSIQTDWIHVDFPPCPSPDTTNTFTPTPTVTNTPTPAATNTPTPTLAPNTLPTEAPTSDPAITPTSAPVSNTTLLLALNDQDVPSSPTELTVVFTLRNRDTNSLVAGAPASEKFKRAAENLGKKYSVNVSLAKLQEGEYLIFFRKDKMIARSAFNVSSAKDLTPVPTATLVFGDVNQDNNINISDHEELRRCWQGKLGVGWGSCAESDFDKNTVTDQIDYNTWLRGFETWSKEGRNL